VSDTFELRGAKELAELSAALKEASDRDLTNRVRGAMRGVAKPVGVRVLRAGAESMPHHGGFADRVASRGRVGLSTALVARTVHVTLTLSNKGADMKSLDAGILRHPVFKRGDQKARWVRQSVPEAAFSHAFDAEAPMVAREVLTAAEATLETVARKVR
jgi:hypothetical protein